jgi:hypothetical protein
MYNIRLSDKIDKLDCPRCDRRRPWADTITQIQAQLRAHGVSWRDFQIIHGRYLTCDEALKDPGFKNAGLYVIAVDSQGMEAKAAKVFARKDPHFVGVANVLNGKAFVQQSAENDDDD